MCHFFFTKTKICSPCLTWEGVGLGWRKGYKTACRACRVGQSFRMLSRVCLVLDLEGFEVQGQFLVRELGWCDWDGTALGPFSLLPHPALSGGLERQTSHSLCTPPHPRFTLYSRPPRTSPSGNPPGKGCQRSRAQVPTTRQDGGGLQRRTLRKRAVAALGHPAFQLGTSPVS